MTPFWRGGTDSARELVLCGLEGNHSQLERECLVVSDTSMQVSSVVLGLS